MTVIVSEGIFCESAEHQNEDRYSSKHHFFTKGTESHAKQEARNATQRWLILSIYARLGVFCVKDFLKKEHIFCAWCNAERNFSRQGD